MKKYELFKSFIYKIINSRVNDIDLSNEEIEFIYEEFNSLFMNSGSKLKLKSFFTLDQELEAFRHRPENQDFNKKYEFIFSGCSQTHGDFITPPMAPEGSHNYIWGFQVANNYSKEALNLGMGGWSAEAIHKGLMNHFQKNGHPKVLLVLYPDFGRMPFVYNEKVGPIKVLNNHELVQHIFLNPNDEFDYEKYSKAPHVSHNVFPWTQALYLNLQSIMILDQYCKANNIYFKYSSWDYLSNIILKLLKKHFVEYKNYVELDPLNIIELKKIKLCHSDVSKNYPESIWHVGKDAAHMGIHQQIHVYEAFKKELDRDNPWN